jgi:hypothetical protein
MSDRTHTNRTSASKRIDTIEEEKYGDIADAVDVEEVEQSIDDLFD